MYKIFFVILSLVFIIVLSGCSNTNEFNYNYGEDEMLSKIWDQKIIYNETVVLEDNGTEIYGNLIYKPSKILSVRDYTLAKEYDNSEFSIEGNKIIRSETSTIPYLTSEQLAGINLPEEYGFSTYQAKKQGTNIIFTEGIGIVMHQIAITYIHEDVWTDEKQSYQGEYLSNFLNKLNKKESVRIVVNGDSISTGANSSGVLGIAPYQDDFSTLFANKLKSHYNTEVELINTSVGGMLSSWGKENVDPNVNAYNPDLVLIGFGMNDGSWNIAPIKFKENLDFMIRSIKSRNPAADILLIGTILANPLSLQDMIQEDYLDQLIELQSEHQIGIVDMTSLSKNLFKTKKGVDILANNINHPSDFLVRCYAASLLTAVIKDY